MNAKSAPPAHHAPFLTLADIYHILFRHKWKIILISAASIIIAALLPLFWPRLYKSEAKLLIRYVLETRAPSHPDSNSRVESLNDRGDSIINTELEILTSLDLAQEVATNIGPEKILGKKGLENPYAAGVFIHNHLQVEVPPRSDVIHITLEHPDPALVQPILSQLITSYLNRHVEIHRAVGVFDDFLTRETDQLRSRLGRTEQALRDAKTNLNIVSLDDSRKALNDQAVKIQQNILDANAELAERKAMLAEYSKALRLPAVATNQASTNQVATATNAAPVTPEKMADYKRVCDMLDRLKKYEQDLLVQYLPGNVQVQDVRRQIAAKQKEKEELETENPGLLAMPVLPAEQKSVATAGPQPDILGETAHIAALESRIQVLTNQLADVQKRILELNANEGNLSDLQRTRELEEQNYKYFSANLAQSRIDQELGPGKASNINTIQNPSPPFQDNSKLDKARIGVVAVGVMFALGLAFFLELYFDRSIKRPLEIENRLGVPLLLSIPYRNGHNGNGHPRLLNPPKPGRLLLSSEALNKTVPLTAEKTTIGRGEDNTVSLADASLSVHHCEIFVRDGDTFVKDLNSTNGTFVNDERIQEAVLRAGQTLRLGSVALKVASEITEANGSKFETPARTIAPWEAGHVLRPFYDALRDRLITYFEVKNLTHKPKLVALTSCGEGAGVTSTAAGLAAALSETGDGNVLLVDMNAQHGAAHHFYKGHLACDIDDALQKDKRHEALVQDNLYVVSEGTDEGLPRVLPKRFTHLVPKLKASDYDYIIFDMPPISQISITPRLARFMDIVMMVAESEKTDRDVLQRAVTMLNDARANVAVVLNKRKNYVPQRIQQEL